MKCCICRKDAGKYGNNALPLKDGRCCDTCNYDIIIPLRLGKELMKQSDLDKARFKKYSIGELKK